MLYPLYVLCLLHLQFSIPPLLLGPFLHLGLLFQLFAVWAMDLEAVRSADAVLARMAVNYAEYLQLDARLLKFLIVF